MGSTIVLNKGMILDLAKSILNDRIAIVKIILSKEISNFEKNLEA